MKKILVILKIPGIVVGCIASLYLVFSFFDGMSDNIVDTKDMVEFNNIQINDLSIELIDIKDTLKKYEAEHRKQGEDIKSIEWGLMQHENFTPEQFEEVMEELLKKNYSLNPTPSSYETPVAGNDTEDGHELGNLN